MKTYTKKIDDFGFEYIEMISENGIISIVPTDSTNSDYQRYLRSLQNLEAEGTIN